MNWIENYDQELQMEAQQQELEEQSLREQSLDKWQWIDEE